MLSRLFQRCLTQPARSSLTSSSLFYSFTTAVPPKKVSPIHYKIFETNSWDAFIQLFKEEREQFTQDVIAGTSKHISNVLAKQKDRVNFSQIEDVLSVLEQMNIQDLSPRNIINLLTMLRYFSYRGFHQSKYHNLKINLCKQYTTKIRSQQSSADLSQLLFGYFQMVYFSYVPAIKSITQIIKNQIQNQSSNQNLFNQQQLSFLIHVLAFKGQLITSQTKIRKYVLQSIASKVNTMKIKDIVKIVTDINRMDIVDMESQEFFYIKTIGEKVIEGINQIDQKSIYELLRGDNINRNSIYNRIYDQILKNIFAQINEDGSTEMDPESILKMLSFLSAKTKVQRQPEPYRKKLTAFLLHYSSQQLQVQQLRAFHNYFLTLLHNNYINKNSAEQISEIVQKSTKNDPSKVGIGLIDALYGVNADISPYIQNLVSRGVEKLNHEKIVRMAIFIRKIENNQRYNMYKQKIQMFSDTVKKALSQSYSSQQNFIQLIRNIPKPTKSHQNPLSFHLLHSMYPQLFQTLPNPFSSQSSQVQATAYTHYYLTYITLSLKTRQLVHWLNMYQKNINADHYNGLIRNILEKDNRNVQTNKNVIMLTFKIAEQIFQSKNKKAITAVFEVLDRYCRFVVLGELKNDGSQQLMWKIIHKCINKIEMFQENGAGYIFESIMTKYVTRNHRNYKVDSPYKQFLSHLLSKAHLLQKNAGLLPTLLNEALPLNLVTPKSIQSIPIAKLRLPFVNRAMLQSLRDPSYTPQLNNISHRTLPLLLSIPTLQQQAISNIPKIRQLISKMFITQAAKCIVHFNLPVYRKPTNTLYLQLLNRIVIGGQDTINVFERADMLGVVNHITKNNTTALFPVNKIAQKLIQHLNKRVYTYSLQAHLSFINFLSTQPALNLTSYLTQLSNYLKNNQNFTAGQQYQFLYKLTFTNFQFNEYQLNQISEVAKKDPFLATVLFTTQEQKIENEEKRKQIVKDIVEQAKKLKSNQTVMSNMRYNYLKHSYPNQTQDLSLTGDQLKPIKCTRPISSSLKSVLQSIATQKDLKLQQVQLVDDNIAFWLGQSHLLLFWSTKHLAALHQHQFIKKALTLQFEQEGKKDVKIVGVGITNPIGLVHYLNKNHAELVDEATVKKIVEELEKNKSNKKGGAKHEEEQLEE